MRMRSHHGEVTKDKAEIIAEKFADTLDDRKEFSAMDALEVSILEKRNGCGFRSGRVIAFRYGIP
jgi:hypothetical protein